MLTMLACQGKPLGGDKMTEQTSSLRFDIYERVHLAEDQPDMKSLDSIEMVPLIQVNAEGEQAQLKGNLLLTGQYFSDLDNETRTLEHWIPVEITLPLNRVERLEDISVEIENFDIDLLSSRLLNVTGVLSLRGFDNVPAAQDWQEESQLFLQEIEDDRVKPKPKINPEVTPDLLPEESNAETLIGFDSIEKDGTWLESTETMAVQESIWSDEPVIFNETEVIRPETVTPFVEDKKELKVGFGSKPSSAHDHLQNIKNLMQGDPEGKSSATRFNGDRETNVEQTREGTRGDELEWKRLFLGERGNERSFQKVRLCIVQKEETIDGIAERYSINPREIMLFNRMSNYQVAAGQVIYIPS
jgi:stage VI sporulation protein D